ncbi:CheR family methyltransferase [Bacillus sp. JJ1764]|uniref:CheR family methyltransferase n=1 Tax=Bacillus sp. JJ1764 TaxID=3122964 RepID=UPI002FFFF20B
MKKQELSELATLIREYCGIDFSSNLTSLDLKVSRRLMELNLNIDEYLFYLQKNRTEWDKLVEYITINETYFFREFNQLQEFQNLLRKTSGKTIQVWCVPCSTGEEAYSLAMLAKEMEPLTGNRVRIMASDLNKKVLDQAKSGFYSKNSFSFRRFPENSKYLNKYFIEHEDGYEVKNEIKQMITFEAFNLADFYLYSKFGQLDFIFCRNVLIYFDEDMKKSIVNQFYSTLKKDGYLFLGHAESISNIKSQFVPIYTKDTFYYTKSEEMVPETGISRLSF